MNQESLRNREKRFTISIAPYIHCVSTMSRARVRDVVACYACVAKVNWFRLRRPARCYHSI